jgi:predicted HNH restriction endonuclease
MMKKINLNNTFLRYRNCSGSRRYNELDSEMKDLWEHKTQYQRKEEHTAEDFYSRGRNMGWIWKNRVVSLYFVIKGDVRNFRVTSFFGEEGKILKDFNNLLGNHFNQPQHICAAIMLKNLIFRFWQEEWLLTK